MKMYLPCFSRICLLTTLIVMLSPNAHAAAATTTKNSSPTLSKKQIQWICAGAAAVVSVSIIALVINANRAKKNTTSEPCRNSSSPVSTKSSQIAPESHLIDTGNAYLDARLFAVHNCRNAFGHIGAAFKGATLSGNAFDFTQWFLKFFKQATFNTTDLRESIAALQLPDEQDLFTEMMHTMLAYDRTQNYVYFSTLPGETPAPSVVRAYVPMNIVAGKPLQDQLNNFLKSSPEHIEAILRVPILHMQLKDNIVGTPCPLAYRYNKHVFELRSIVLCNNSKIGAARYTTYIKKGTEWHAFDPQQQSCTPINLDSIELIMLETTGRTKDGVPVDIFYMQQQAAARTVVV